MRIRPASLCVLALLSLLAACTPPGTADSGGSSSGGVRISGLIIDDELQETSGLAASKTHDGLLWAHNDGSDRRLYLLGPLGKRHARYTLQNVALRDIEDIARFTQDGRSYLLLADTGDNGGIRKELALIAVEEPRALEADGKLTPAWTLRFRWPDGPRDCEAIAVDSAAGKILLISKKRKPAELYVLPLSPKDRDAVQVAEKIATLHGIPVATAQEERDNPTIARLHGQVTAADLSPDGRTLAVLTYHDIVLYRRQPGQAWSAVGDKPSWVHPVGLSQQPEALTWTRSGRGLYITGEFNPTPLLYVTPPD